MTRAGRAALAAACALLPLACVVPPAAPAQAPPIASRAPNIDGAAWLAPEAARARAVGAGDLEVLGADVASEGDRVGAFIDLRPDRCVLAITRSSPQVIDADLFAYEEDGGTFAADDSPDAQAALLLCSTTPKRLFVMARVITGAGIVAVGVMPVPKAAEAGVRRAFAARGAGEDDGGRSEGFPGLEGRLRAHRAALGGRWDEVRRITVPLDARAATRVSAEVEAGRCVDVFVAGSDEVTSVDVAVEDDKGRLVATGKPTGRDRTLIVCADRGAPLDITLRARSAQGQASVSVARSARGGDAELAPGVRALHVSAPKELAPARAALDASLRARGYGPGKQIAMGVAKVGVRASAAVDLPRGCARLDVIVGAPFAELAAALWDDKGSQLAEARAGGAAPLFTCGAGGPARVDLEPLEISGPYAIEIRPDRGAPAALVAHPVAAARLLGRLAAAGIEATAETLTDARVVALEPGSLKSVPIAAPPNGCAEVFVALDRGGFGLDLRVLESKTRDGDVARARFVTVNRLCAGASGAQGSVELRLDAGRAEALAWVRTVPP